MYRIVQGTWAYREYSCEAPAQQVGFSSNYRNLEIRFLFSGIPFLKPVWDSLNQLMSQTGVFTPRDTDGVWLFFPDALDTDVMFLGSVGLHLTILDTYTGYLKKIGGSPIVPKVKNRSIVRHSRSNRFVFSVIRSIRPDKNDRVGF